MLNADTWQPAWGGGRYGPTPCDWVRAADKLVSGGVSLLNGTRPARPSVAEAGKQPQQVVQLMTRVQPAWPLS